MSSARAADAAVRDQAPLGVAARRADDAQGHVLPGRQAQHLRLGAAARLAADDHRDGDRAAGGGGRLHVRRPEHGRVRAEPDRPQQDVRRLPQSLEPAVYHRRVVVRFRRVGGGAVQLHGARLGHRRVDPAAGLGQRRQRASSRRRPGCPVTASCRCRSPTTMSAR